MPLALGAVPGSARAEVFTGLDVMVADGFLPLRGKKVGVITNHTGVDRRGRHIVDLLKSEPSVKLAAVFSPEHGFTGRVEHGQRIEDDIHGGVLVYSLYGKTKRPTPEMLKGLDALVFDIQDVGARFYTYITTMGYALEEAAKAGIEFYVFDRPNPITGRIVEGEILDPSIRHFTAYFSVPARHGLTVGEIAVLHNDQARLGARLRVIKMEGWNRGWWQDTGLKFIPPSPNIRDPRTALLYSGIGAFEATNVSVGRGTSIPFQVLGAPWMDGKALAKRLSKARLPGVRFKPVTFMPDGQNLYSGQLCRGVRLVVTDPDALRTMDVFTHAACAVRDLYRTRFELRWEEMPRLVGSKRFEDAFISDQTAKQILVPFHAGAEAFMRQRKPYLLYP
ncbi:MAG: exo-beta-N-acetylmuramidase NamZ family protein [Elusimicrobiota bacterium]